VHLDSDGQVLQNKYTGGKRGTTAQPKENRDPAANGVEQVELEQPKQAVEEAGARTEVLSLNEGEIQAVKSDINPTQKIAVDKKVSDCSVDDYDGLILPGGAVNPDNLRQDKSAVSFVQDFFKAGKPVGVICHGPWTLVEADVVRGRMITSYPSVRTDLRNAGANVTDAEVVTDRGLVSSRGPNDLPVFCNKIVEEFAEGKHAVSKAGATT
jgi:protease I